MLKIVCWKWEPLDDSFRKKGTYTSKHVNILYNMVSRHLHIPFEMVCITDNPEGINENIRIVKLWNDFRGYGMCWTRLKAFSPEMKEIIGEKFVSIDLDCVILKDITPLFNNNNDFMMWEKERMYCGSLWMLKSGARSEVWRKFSRRDLFKKGEKWLHRRAYKRGFKTTSDQSFISFMLYNKEKSWTKKDGVYNFDTEIYKKQVNMNNVRIVFFNGKKDPSDKHIQEQYPWIKENWR